MININYSFDLTPFKRLLFQACKAGRVQHLEHLLFYGAEMNAQNSSGNTPLHVCAVNNQVIYLAFCV